MQPGNIGEQQLETLTEQQEGEPEDDSYLQSLENLRKHRMNLNFADENELRGLPMLAERQIASLVRYMKLLGRLISIYELQSVPEWDVATIQKVLPYVTVSGSVALSSDVKARFLKGQHSILVRMQQVLEKSAGYLRPDSVENRYRGSQQRIFLRYKYIYRNLLQFGITADKDAGENFFRGQQRNGFDFYSFHLFARKLGVIKTIALGDFTVNLGQGLVQWQSLAFKKSADITVVKRQAEVLRPYNSAGEYNFQRGAGITFGVKSFEVTTFASVRSLDATFNNDTSQHNSDFVSTILNTGYHRTPNEVAKKNTITQTSFGGNVSYNRNGLHVGVNGVSFQFSVPLIRDIQPYNQYAIRGNNWNNYSIDYAYTFRNIHFFGEAATDKKGSRAILSGLLASVDPKVDLSILYRNLEKSYQTLYGNAFTENTFPTNEKGLFAGITVKPHPYFRIDGYADMFSFPWLRYRVDAPSKGQEYLLQLTYKPNKQLEIFTRYKSENKAGNISGLQLPVRPVLMQPKQNWRTQLTYIFTREFTLRNRVEIIRFYPNSKDRSQQGFLAYVDARYKPANKPFSFNGRLLHFQTDGFESRLYAFESDILYSFSIPQLLGKGMRYYLNFDVDVTKKMKAGLRWAQTIYTNQIEIGSGLDKINGSKKSDVKLQVMYNF